MDIYVVQQGDTIDSIAESFGVSVQKLINDNGFEYPYELIIGQTIVITYPKQSYIVQEGDTLQGIADANNVNVMQILRNNPFLSDRRFLYVGETLVISYNTSRSITATGFAYPYIKPDILKKTLPNLTYLSIFNYRVQKNGEIISFSDDSEIITTAKEYGVIPLMIISILTPQGEPDAETAQRILTSDEYQERIINDLTDIMKNKGYLGLNMVINFLSASNQLLFQNYLQKISDRLRQEGLLFIITINYYDQLINEISNIDFGKLSASVNGIIFLKFLWGSNSGPPAPVSNINVIREITNVVASKISSDKIVIGKPTIGYDWQLPYEPNVTKAVSLSLNSVLKLAYEVGAVIQFDENSRTPFFTYDQITTAFPLQHIVWFIDARSIYNLFELIKEYALAGSGIWNIMIYNPQLWSIINVEFDIIKLL